MYKTKNSSLFNNCLRYTAEIYKHYICTIPFYGIDSPSLGRIFAYLRVIEQKGERKQFSFYCILFYQQKIDFREFYIIHFLLFFKKFNKKFYYKVGQKNPKFSGGSNHLL